MNIYQLFRDMMNKDRIDYHPTFHALNSGRVGRNTVHHVISLTPPGQSMSKNTSHTLKVKKSYRHH